MTIRPIEQVLQEKTDQWMAMPGVISTAIGTSKGRPCILVLTSLDPAELRANIPATVEGHPVVIERTHEIRALDRER